MTLFRVCLCLAATALATPAIAQEPANMNTEILKAKVKADNTLLEGSNMNLSEGGGKSFWLLYEEYQRALDSINQRLLITIKGYADDYNAGEGDISKAAALAVEEAGVRLRQSYAGRLEKVSPSRRPTGNPHPK